MIRVLMYGQSTASCYKEYFTYLFLSPFNFTTCSIFLLYCIRVRLSANNTIFLYFHTMNTKKEFFKTKDYYDSDKSSMTYNFTLTDTIEADFMCTEIFTFD